MAEARDLWINQRKRLFNKALSRLIFIDETSTNTRLTKRTGWSRKGDRSVAYAPFGKWNTQTFIAGPRCHGLTAPWIVDAPMNRRIFETLIDTQLARTLSPATVPSSTMSVCTKARAEQLVTAKGAWFLFLPPYSPDLNPIGMAFSKLKARLRKRAARSFDTIAQALRDIICLFSVAECSNFFKAAGYEAE
ncbi:transposase [Hoeflea sp.]|uniref:transposase n=1 Tax=Hoeflea sp. TaxID=1940281 RepID=UPI0025C00353|nr:transposase [Hoeflea sp.]